MTEQEKLEKRKRERKGVVLRLLFSLSHVC